LVRLAEWRTLRFQGAGVLTARWGPWLAARLPYSLTLGRAIGYTPAQYDKTVAIDGEVECHEFVHIRQCEDDMVRSLLLGLIVTIFGAVWAGGFGPWLLGLGIYFSGGMWTAIGFLTAGMRWGWSWETMYLYSESELSAYAQTERTQGKSWADIHREMRP